VISVLFWMAFDLLTTTAALYARALVPDLADPVTAFPALGEQILPPLARGLFVVSLLAVVMSTVDSYLFLGGITLGRDIVWRRRGGLDERSINRYTCAALLVTAVLAVVLALWFRSVVDIWHDLGSVGTPALLLPLALSFSARLRPGSRTAALMMLGGGGVALAWLIWPSLPWYTTYPWGLEPIFPGLVVSLTIYLVGRQWRTPTLL
jgi:SSS family solute:Na+ symporter